MAYRQDLEKRERKLINEIRALELLEKQYMSDLFSDKFNAIRSELNEKRINLMTVKSRIKHIGRNYGGVAVQRVDDNHFKNKTR